jgi:hypothetical protein
MAASLFTAVNIIFLRKYTVEHAFPSDTASETFLLFVELACDGRFLGAFKLFDDDADEGIDDSCFGTSKPKDANISGAMIR